MKIEILVDFLQAFFLFGQIARYSSQRFVDTTAMMFD
jgi:hypothetical protein